MDLLSFLFVCCSSSYESKVNEVAKERNIIALLETGTDKSTLIDMLVKGMMRMTSSHVAKRLIIYLAPTVNLVKQASLLFSFI